MKKLLTLFILAFSLSINAQIKDSTKVDNFQKIDKILSEVVKKGSTTFNSADRKRKCYS